MVKEKAAVWIQFLQIIIDFYIAEKYINKSLEDIYPGTTKNNLVKTKKVMWIQESFSPTLL